MKNLTTATLVSKLQSLVGEERKILSEILSYLHEVDLRKIFLELGYPSLFEFCVKCLNYSEGAAHRRISAMRLIFNLPEAQKELIDEKVQSGSLTLTVLAQASQFFKLEKKESGKNYSTSEKVQILEKLEGKSKRESERELAKISSVAVVPKESLRSVNGEQSVLQVTIDSDLLEKLNRIKELISHKNPNPSYAELLHEMANMVLKSKGAKSPSQIRTPHSVDLASKTASSIDNVNMKMERSGTITQHNIGTDGFVVPPVEVEALQKEELEIQMGVPRSRYISNKIKTYIWQKDGGQCSFVSQSTGLRCGSRHFVQIDHIIEFSKGGSSLNPKNLRLLCGAHNRGRTSYCKANIRHFV